MFGFEFSHILVLAAIALIVLGPKQMPQLAKVLGRTLGELKKAMNDLTNEMTAEVTKDKSSHGEASSIQATKPPEIETEKTKEKS